MSSKKDRDFVKHFFVGLLIILAALGLLMFITLKLLTAPDPCAWLLPIK